LAEGRLLLYAEANSRTRGAPALQSALVRSPALRLAPLRFSPPLAFCFERQPEDFWGLVVRARALNRQPAAAGGSSSLRRVFARDEAALPRKAEGNPPAEPGTGW